jgi:hypothetical protein
VVLAVISHNMHDEALRELPLQLAIADLLVLAADSFVGYRTARAALYPIEAYRRATLGTEHESGGRLRVEDRDDEFFLLVGAHAQRPARTNRHRGGPRAPVPGRTAHQLRTPLTLMTSELDWPPIDGGPPSRCRKSSRRCRPR